MTVTKVEELRNYEMTVIFNDSDPELFEKSKNMLETSFQKRNVSISEKEEWGSRKLFHAIDHIEKGHFNYLTFTTSPDKINQLNADINVNQGILKSMICRVP